jgi:N-methylhydantoinase A
MDPGLRIGIDIGGTFTDFVVYEPETRQLDAFKLLSTPGDPAAAVIQGLEKILLEHQGHSAWVIHGSTVATNALLERRGAETAFVATAGFKDLLQIGRQNRPALYDLLADPQPALVPPDLRFEVEERVDRHGSVLAPLEPAKVEGLVENIRRQGATSVAVCLLFSFVRPDHEQILSAALRAAGLTVSASSEILPEFREYERASTTAVNAYVSPLLEQYLANLERAFATGAFGPAGVPERARVSLRVMQSNGGNISPGEARKFGVRCILSGPAGGVIGCEHVAGMGLSSRPSPTAGAERTRVITFDMGGTSTDVSLIDGGPRVTTEAVIGGCPISIPVLDIHTIGAGGGSIARVDPGGALLVGPESAGSDPGPACYGRRGAVLPTVTDANLVLGRLAPEYFLGGQMPLDPAPAQAALARLGAALGLSAEQAALGVVQIANVHMERALRVISVERGHDPRDFTLLSFGGAGGLHASELARSLGVRRVLVPPLASTLSAFGMLAAEVVKDYTQTIMRSGDTPAQTLAALLDSLAARGLLEVESEGVSAAKIRVERSLDLRYRGQSYELTVPFGEDFTTTFHAMHEKTYGYDRPGVPLEIVNLRVRVIGETEPPLREPETEGDADPAAAYLLARPVVFADGAHLTPFFRAEALRPGNVLIGPAIIVRSDTTVLIGLGDNAHVDGFGNLAIEIPQVSGGGNGDQQR